MAVDLKKLFIHNIGTRLTGHLHCVQQMIIVLSKLGRISFFAVVYTELFKGGQVCTL